MYAQKFLEENLISLPKIYEKKKIMFHISSSAAGAEHSRDSESGTLLVQGGYCDAGRRVYAVSPISESTRFRWTRAA